MVVHPAPLRPGNRIGVTSPSSGVPARLRGRLDVAVRWLGEQGYDVVVGECMDGEGVVSAPAPARAAELTAMLTDPTVAAVVPPWGGELAVEVLPHLDWAAIAAAAPTWLVGYSDTSTLLLALTTRTGTASLHGQNLMDSPYRVPAPLATWEAVASSPPGATITQGASYRHRLGGYDDWEADPTVTEPTFDTTGRWQLLDPGAGDLHVRGRLLGGCIETVSTLAGTPYGDVGTFVAQHAPEGLLLYLEAAGDSATDIARHLWRLRLAGWFEHASGVLVGRTTAPDAPGLTQREAVLSALDGTGLPVVLDVDCGHVPPHLALVNGALADLAVTAGEQTLTQVLT